MSPNWLSKIPRSLRGSERCHNPRMRDRAAELHTMHAIDLHKTGRV